MKKYDVYTVGYVVQLKSRKIIKKSKDNLRESDKKCRRVE